MVDLPCEDGGWDGGPQLGPGLATHGQRTEAWGRRRLTGQHLGSDDQPAGGLIVNGGGSPGKKSSLIQRDSRAGKFVGNADAWDIGLGGGRTQGCLPHNELQ